MRHFVPWPAAPANAATIILFTTHPITVATLVPNNLQVAPSVPASRIIAWEGVWLRNDQASAANGIRLYALDDAGTFREVDCKDDFGVATIGSVAPQAVAVLSTGQERRLLIDTARYNGFAVLYTAGATGPTNWNGVQHVHLDAESIIR